MTLTFTQRCLKRTRIMHPSSCTMVLHTQMALFISVMPSIRSLKTSSLSTSPCVASTRPMFLAGTAMACQLKTRLRNSSAKRRWPRSIRLRSVRSVVNTLLNSLMVSVRASNVLVCAASGIILTLPICPNMKQAILRFSRSFILTVACIVAVSPFIGAATVTRHLLKPKLNTVTK